MCKWRLNTVVTLYIKMMRNGEENYLEKIPNSSEKNGVSWFGIIPFGNWKSECDI